MLNICDAKLYTVQFFFCFFFLMLPYYLSPLLSSLPKSLVTITTDPNISGFTDVWGSSSSLKDGLDHCLGVVASTLCHKAKKLGQETLHFLHQNSARSHKCLMMDSKLIPAGRGPRVDGKKHYYRDRRGYLCLSLAKRLPCHGGWIRERGHRIVLYCMYGGPPASIHDPVVMHACDEIDLLKQNDATLARDIGFLTQVIRD